MKPLILITVAIGILLSGSLFARPPEEYKQVAPPPLPQIYGTGFYGAIDGGATISPKNDVGGFGDLKLGYVFGTGVFSSDH